MNITTILLVLVVLKFAYQLNSCYLQYNCLTFDSVHHIIMSLACLLRILALREVKESKLLLAFGQCIMKLLGLNITFSKRRLILKIK